MLSKNTKRWLNNNGIQSLSGKTVLITGATSGIGLKSTELMVFLKARVIMACRNLTKAQQVKAELLSEYPDAQIEIMRLDLADFESIDSFVRQIESNRENIDLFLNNAGVFRKPGQLTLDGYDMVIGTNYLGVYRITEQILGYLKTLPHEVIYVNTVSIAHKIGSVDYSDYFYTKKYCNLKVYARSKLCLAKYTYELSKRYDGTNIRILMSHPGIAITPLGANAFGIVVKRLSRVFGWLFNTAEKSALSLPYIMAKNVPAGKIVGPNGFLCGWGYPEINRTGKCVKTGGKELIEFTIKLLEQNNKHRLN